jgi:flagellar secretion chaperone FliS
MAPGNDAGDAYIRNKILNATPIELTMILYEGAIASLHKYKQLFADKQHEQACDELIKGQDMIRALRDSLDLSVSNIGAGLYRLYEYMLRKLINANIDKNMNPVDEVIHMLTDLKDTWRQASANHIEDPRANAKTPPEIGGNTNLISIIS